MSYPSMSARPILMPDQVRAESVCLYLGLLMHLEKLVKEKGPNSTKEAVCLITEAGFQTEWRLAAAYADRAIGFSGSVEQIERARKLRFQAFFDLIETNLGLPTKETREKHGSKHRTENLGALSGAITAPGFRQEGCDRTARCGGNLRANNHAGRS